MDISSSAFLGEMYNLVFDSVAKATKDIVAMMHKDKDVLRFTWLNRESLRMMRPRVQIWPIDEEQRTCDQIATGLPFNLVALKDLLEGFMYMRFGSNKTILFDLGD